MILNTNTLTGWPVASGTVQMIATVASIVLDPFSGSGTTGAVA